MLIVLPVINLLVQLIILQTVFDAIGKVFDEPEDWDKLSKQIIAFLYPTFVIICTIFSGGIFVFTPLKDHFNGIRTVLNFSGITPIRY